MRLRLVTGGILSFLIISTSVAGVGERWSWAKTMAFTCAFNVLAIIAYLIFGELYK